MNYKNIDIERLREDLIDYFGSAMYAGFNMAIVDLSNVQSASTEELIDIAIKNKFNLKKYEIFDATSLTLKNKKTIY